MMFNSSSLVGLSPLARGTQITASKIRIKMRFIPAGAGNTATNCS